MSSSAMTEEQSTGSSTNAFSAEHLPAQMSCDVVIVGYGPVGMIIGTLLAERGRSVIVVERWPTRYDLPRAGHFDSETMRTFQNMGFAESIELIARPMLQWHMVTADMELLTTIKLGEGGSGWKESYLTYQPEFEKIFDARARELGVRVFMNTTAVRLEQDADGARLFVQSSSQPNSEPTVINASFILGADGAGSFVRSAVGIERMDLGFKANDQLVIDFEHNDADRDLPQLPEVYQVLDPNRPLLAGRWSGDRWSRFEFHAKEGESREYLESDETCWKLLAKWGIYPGDGKITRHSVYSFQSKLASKWRVGRVLLVGDAAHTMPPFMGQGLCSGIRDSLNLYWKLDALLSGRADLEFLDTYESEREPHARGITEMSNAVGNLVLMHDPEQARQRDEMLRAGHAPRAPVFPRLGPGIVRSPDSPNSHPTDGRPSRQGRAALGRRVDRLDQFMKRGWKIISRHPVALSMFKERQQDLLTALDMDFAHVSRGANAQYADIDGEYDLWYRETGRKAFLLRPDNYVYGSVRTIEELPAMLDELGDVLAAHGWKDAKVKRNLNVDALEAVRP
jgi:2-polyprenyl-6-methoxyphenol hydroxylase-like FAD-dependent oxidoreductase